MRPGLPLVVATFCLGVFAADLAWPLVAGPAFHGLALACVLGAVSAARAPGARTGLALLLAFSAGAGSLAARLDDGERRAPTSSRELSLEARVCGFDRVGERRSLELCSSVQVASPGLEELAPDFARLPGRLLGQYRGASPEAEILDALRPGDRLRARVRLGPLGGLRNPGRPDPERRWRRRGIGGRVHFLDPGLLVVVRRAPEAFGVWLLEARLGSAIEGVRRRIARELRRGPGADEAGGLLAALAVGERDGLAARTRDEFARLGIAHVLAISGLHLGLVAGLIFSLARSLLGRRGDRGRDPRVGAAFLAALGAGGFAVLAGFGTPVQRALVFVWLGLGALSLGRRLATGHIVASAALLIGLGAPAALFELGTQLSLAATAALLWAYEHRPVQVPGSVPFVLRVGRRAASLLRLSAVALLATAPWLAWRGLSVAAAGLWVNVIAIPWTSFVLLPAALGAAGAVGLGGAVGPWVLGLAHGVAGLTLAVAGGLAAGLPGAWGVQGGRPGLMALAVSAGLALLGGRLARTWQVVVVALASVAWLGGTPVADPAPPPPRLVMFDVGQGDALLIQGRGASILVDGGRAIPGRIDLGRSVVVPGLAALGVDALAAVVVTHGDIDHRGGIPAILDAMPVEEVWLPWGGAAEPAFAGLLEVALRRGVEVVETGAEGEPRAFADLRVTPIWPPRGRVPTGAGDGPNARSLVLRVDTAGERILLAADIGVAVEAVLVASGADLSADLLKVAHHGSGGSSSSAFLEAVGPRRLLLSAPCGRSSRLPHPAALARFAASGAELSWTGRDGAVVVELDGGPRGPGAGGAPAWGGERPCAGAP